MTLPFRLSGRAVHGEKSCSHERPRDEWIYIPFSSIVSYETFALSSYLFTDNKRFAPLLTIELSIVEGFFSCRKCVYALSLRRRAALLSISSFFSSSSLSLISISASSVLLPTYPPFPSLSYLLAIFLPPYLFLFSHPFFSLSSPLLISLFLSFLSSSILSLSLSFSHHLYLFSPFHFLPFLPLFPLLLLLLFPFLLSLSLSSGRYCIPSSFCCLPFFFPSPLLFPFLLPSVSTLLLNHFISPISFISSSSFSYTSSFSFHYHYPSLYPFLP